MAISAKLIGDKAINAKFSKMKSAMKPELKSFHADGAKIVEREAVTQVPVRTGALRQSIRSTGTLRDGVVRAGKARVPYAGPIHFGWTARNIRPQPFMYDALDARLPEVLEVFDDGIKKLIRKYNLD